MSFPRYPKYKDSGVEWLGEVPEHWEVGTIKHFAQTITDGAHVSPETEGGMYPFVSTKDVLGESIDLEGCLRTSASSYEYMVKTGCKPELGDVLFSKDGTIGRTVVVRHPDDFVVASSLIIIRPKRNLLNPNFLNRLCQSNMVAAQVDSFVKGAGLPRLSIQNLLKVFGCFPPIAEQALIVDFLDREARKIDELVAEQQRLMELLKEKRQAVISHAVTKGLNPRAPMKPSGIEWLGDVPEHWKMVPLRWASTCCSGDGLPSEEVESIQDEEHTVKTIGGNGLMGYTTKGNIEHSILAVGRVGALCGNIHVVTPPAWITDNALILDADSDVFDLRFLGSVLRSRNLNEISSRTAQPLITGTQVGDQRIPAPPLREQQAITAFLDVELAELDALAAEAQKAIDLLQERRTALISAAVTGQIDVRKLAAA